MCPPWLRPSSLVLACLLLVWSGILHAQITPATAAGGSATGLSVVRQFPGGTREALSTLGGRPGGGIYYAADDNTSDRIGAFALPSVRFSWTLPNGTLLRDERLGQFTTMVSSPALSQYGLGWVGNTNVCFFGDLTGWTWRGPSNPHSACEYHLLLNSVPGFDSGSRGNTPSVGWYVSVGQFNSSYFWSQGIHAGIQNNGYCGGIGDCNWWSSYLFAKPAHIKGSDEGVREMQFNVTEVEPYTGTVIQSAPGAPGQTKLQLTRTGGSEGFGLGVGHPFIDTGTPNRVFEAANASGRTTVYTGVFARGAANGLVHTEVAISGFGKDPNNGSFVIQSSTGTSITVNNPAGVAETLTSTTANAQLNLIHCSGSSYKDASLFGTVTVSGCTLPVSSSQGSLPKKIDVNPSINGVPTLVQIPLRGLNAEVKAGDIFSLLGDPFVEAVAVARVVEAYNAAEKTETIEVPLQYTHSDKEGWCVGGGAGRWLEATDNSRENYRYFFNIACVPSATTMLITVEDSSWQHPMQRIGGPINVLHGGVLLDVRDGTAPQEAVTGANLIVTTSDAGTFLPGTTVINANNVVGFGGYAADKFLYNNHNPYSFLRHKTVYYAGIGTNTGLISEESRNEGPPSQYVNSGGTMFGANWLLWRGVLGEAIHLDYEPQGSLEQGGTRVGAIIHVAGRAPGSTNPFYDIWRQGADFLRWNDGIQRLIFNVGGTVNNGQTDGNQRFLANTNGNNANSGYFWSDKNGVANQRTWGARVYAGQWHLATYDDSMVKGTDVITIQSGTGQVDLVTANATVHGVKICDANGNNCPGAGVPATVAAGGGVRSASCVDASGAAIQCSSTRGSVRISGGAATTGPIASLRWSAEGSVRICMVSQNGGAKSYGLGHTAPSTTGFAITAASSVAGAAIDLDYTCSR